MISEPTLLFCLGANKAGTSWLYRYLAAHPECRMPLIKELHYFDARHFGKVVAERRRIVALRDNAARELGSASGARAVALRAEVAELDEWLSVINAGDVDDQAYRGFLMTRAGQAKLAGDMTPAYALLPEAVLGRMQSLANSVRFLYILRDPVDRLWSNLRMNAARVSRDAGLVATEALRMFDAWASGGEKPVRKRSDYAGTLARLTQAIRPANLSVIFYERLFNPASMDRLCAFLGISPHPADFAKPVHAGIAAVLDAGRQAQARVLLAPQYDYVHRTIGDLPPRWRENMSEM